MKTITIQKKKEQTIANATDVFYYIDSDFKNWKTDKISKLKNGSTLVVHDITENKTFAQIFTDPEKMWLSQGQIIEFCRSHKDELSKNWYTFFLFKVGDDFFVARVVVNSGGFLYADVYRFSNDSVWDAGRGRRVVIPQLIPKPLDKETLSPLEILTLESRLKNVEQFLREHFNHFTI